MFIAIGGIVLVVAMSIGAGVVLYRVNASVEVTREPVASAVNPFAPAGLGGTDEPDVQPPPRSGGAFSAATAGLYGGTLNGSTCDTGKLVRYLAGEPDRAKAWAEAQGVPADGIAPLVATLTPVLLRADTAVTNHGWKDGEASPSASILQAGTAVLIDRYGAPAVKCYSGNPLKPDGSGKSRRYVGPTWPGWSAESVVKVDPAPSPQESFTLVDVNTGKPFSRAAGADARDTPVDPQSSGRPSASPSPSPSPSPTKATTSTGQQAATLLQNRIGECAGNNAPYPWPPHKSLNYRWDYRADGEVWTVTIDATKPDDTVELFVWQVNPVENWVSPANGRAREAAQYCSLLGR